MVVSLDLDGLVSAMLMHTLLGWKIVGFYDAQTLWMAQGQDDRSQVIFLDHDICYDQVRSVGHHIVQWDDKTRVHKNMLNPNILRGVTYRQGFAQKYPFGTIHFLLACLAAWDSKRIQAHCSSKGLLAVLLQADSSLQNAFTYQRNALEWLDWLGGSEETSPLYPLCRTLLTSRRLLEWGIAFDDQMQKLGFGGSLYTKRRVQAQRLAPVNLEDWQRLQDLLQWLGGETSWSLDTTTFQPDNAQQIKMGRQSVSPTKKNFEQMLKQGKLFSYALISKGKQGLNHSLLP